MASYKERHFRKGYLVETQGYLIPITAPVLFENLDNIQQRNQPITPELVGVLLGSAYPNIVRVKCKVCSLLIRTKDVVKDTDERLSQTSWNFPQMHEKCYKKTFKQ